MKNGEGFTLRRAEESDCSFLYELRNDPEVRKSSFQTDIIAWEQHEAWFQKKMADNSVRIFIFEQNGTAVGQVRVERIDDQAEISCALCREVRGKGMTKWMIGEMEEQVRMEGFCRKLTAQMKAENIASQKAFRHLGYTEQGTEYGFAYEKEIPLFTITMCTKNSAQTLETAIQSVVRQRFLGWEMLILDNGSSDDTVSILKTWEEKEPRIKCRYREDNVGWPKGISICLEYAKGSYTMFMGADDFLTTEDTLQEVADEVGKHCPEIIWTGCDFTELRDGKYEIIGRVLPQYKVYDGREDKLTQFYELMKTVYYNSVMHYVRIDFLKRIGVDFYKPFLGDCEGMTEAIARARKMVVLDKSEYALTMNTSQTAPKTGYYYDVKRQWNSIRSALPENIEEDRDREKVRYVAARVLNNITAVCQNIVLGEPVRDVYMNDMEKSIPERFARMEEMISTEEMAQMMYYAGPEEYEEALIGAAGVTYWCCKKNEKLTEEITQRSRWLAQFVEMAMKLDETGAVVWKDKFYREEKQQILQAVNNRENHFRIGISLLRKENIWYEDEEIREELEKCSNQYA